MEYLSTYFWERARKGKNTDSLSIQSVTTRKGGLYMACICDGVGEEGSACFASRLVVEYITDWFYTELIPICQKGILSKVIRKSFERNMYLIHEVLLQKGKERRTPLKCNYICLVLYQHSYFLFNKGTNCSYQIRKQAVLQNRRNGDQISNKELLPGGKEYTSSEWKRGMIHRNDVFLLFSDGYGKRIEQIELDSLFGGMQRKKEMEIIEKRLHEIGNRNVRRGEKDSMSAIYVRRTDKWKR